MLLVKTRLGLSSIHGIGLFADEDIAKGTRIWEFTPGFDLQIPKDQFYRIPEASRQDFLKYSYTSINNGHFILCCDDARFFNHSENPNVQDIPGSDPMDEGVTIASRNIQRGEELTCDYRLFEAAFSPDMLS